MQILLFIDLENDQFLKVLLHSATSLIMQFDRLDTTRHFQTCRKLLKKCTRSLWTKSPATNLYQLAANLLSSRRDKRYKLVLIWARQLQAYGRLQFLSSWKCIYYVSKVYMWYYSSFMFKTNKKWINFFVQNYATFCTQSKLI